MAEINNNIPNFGFNKNIDIKNNKPVEQPVVFDEQEEQAKTEYAQDTGVLGRSQIKRTRLKGADIDKSVSEAVFIAKNNPALMGCSEGIFDSLYRDYVEAGMNPDDAYMKALMGEAELLEIANFQNK